MSGYRPFWRRLRFPAHFTLHDLHRAIQAVTLFENDHLHQFVDENDQLYVPKSDAGLGFFAAPSHSRREEETTAGAVLRKKGDNIRYEYDFGDGWDFPIKVESWEPFHKGEKPRIACLGGEKAGPVEDCGGTGGFLNLLKMLASPAPDEKDRWMLEMVGEDYDPERFDVDAANRALARIKGPRIAGPKKTKESPGKADTGE